MSAFPLKLLNFLIQKVFPVPVLCIWPPRLRCCGYTEEELWLSVPLSCMQLTYQVLITASIFFFY